MEQLELDVASADRYQDGEEHAAGARVGRRLRIGDHEEREQEQRAVLQAMKGNRQRLAQPERAADEDRAPRDDECVRHIASRGAIDDEAAHAGDEKREEGKAAPLAGRNPHPRRDEHQRDDGEVCRIENVLSAPAYDEFAGDGDDRGEQRQQHRVAAQEQAQRETGDCRAPRIEAHIPHSGADRLRDDCCDQNCRSARRRDIEMQDGEPVDQQCRQRGDLVEAGIEAFGFHCPIGHRRVQRRNHATE